MFFLTWFADHRGPAGFLQNESRGQIMYQPENPQLQKLTDLLIWFKKVSFLVPNRYYQSSGPSRKPWLFFRFEPSDSEAQNLRLRLPTGYSEVQTGVNPTGISHRGTGDLYTSKGFNRIEKQLDKFLALGCKYVNIHKRRFLTILII